MALDSEDEHSLYSKLSDYGTSLVEKRQILAARDKLLHLKQERQTNLASAVAVVGTCFDMCPEYERYFRIETNQVSPFEMDYSANPNGTPEERKMVKEYRRSGADQKEPLPHELRPINVLEHTMNYLCLKIMDQCYTCSNVGEWFDFVWSRTRSIRKDITQQHLINLQSVDLIEKCARFHIFCSYHLCEQEMKDFDPKINEENLTNCLQTLKDFYYDLSLRSIFCKNESEFRSYDILLNLRNGETLSELKHFKNNIRNSPSVTFAVKIYQAFNSKNFIRFFQFARQANFFMSCILNRYFWLFRIDLFNVIRKAYTIPKSKSLILYPVEDMIKQFAFDDFEELSKFCKFVGLDFDESEENVLFTRTCLVERIDNKIRSQSLVEKKLPQHSTPGRQILCNDDIVDVEIKLVHSSFDQNNRLIFDKSLLSSTNLNALPSSISSDVIVSNENASKENVKNSFTNSAIGGTNFSFNSQVKKLSKPIFSTETAKREDEANEFTENDNMVSYNFKLNNKLFASELNDSSQQLFVEAKPKPPVIHYSAIIESLKIDLFDQSLDVIIKQQCFSSLNAFKKSKKIVQKHSVQLMYKYVDNVVQKIAQSILKSQQNRTRISINFAKKSVDNMLQMVCEMTISEIYQNEWKNVQSNRIKSLSSNLFADLLNQIVSNLARQIFHDVIQDHNKRICLWRENFVLRKYWHKWRNYFLSRKRYKFYRDNFPAAPIKCAADVCSPAPLSGITLIDDNYIKSDNALRRKLVYSKYKDTSVMLKYVKEQLENKANCAADLQAHMEHLKRRHYLEDKYFKLWLANVRKAKRNFVRFHFLAAPPPPSSSSSSSKSCLSKNNSMTDVNKCHYTIIDQQIQKANSSFQRNLLLKLNYDFDTTVNTIKRKLSEREQKFNARLASGPVCHQTNNIANDTDSDMKPLRKRLMISPLTSFLPNH